MLALKRLLETGKLYVYISIYVCIHTHRWELQILS